MEEKIIYDVEVKGTQSIENLTKANKELREERKKLDLQSAEGQKRAQAINKQLDENTNIIKENSSALEKQRLNVGNYSGALDKLVPGLGATANGFGAMKAQAIAFIATPIGAVIGALGLILSGVTKYLTGSAEGQDKLNKVMTLAGAIVGKLSDALAFLGEYAIKGVVEGFNLLIKGLDYLIPGFEKLVDLGIKKVNEALGDPAALAALKNRNDVLERELVLLKATNEARIAELKLKAEDKSLDLITRQNALKEAQKLQDELSVKQREFAANKLEISKQEHAQSNSTKEDLLEEKRLEAELILIDKDRADKSKEIFTKGQDLKNQEIAKLNELSNAAFQADLKIIEGEKLKQTEYKKSVDAIIGIINKYDEYNQLVDFSGALAEANADSKEEQIQAEKDYNEIIAKGNKIKQEQIDRDEASVQSFGNVANALNLLTGVNKKFAAASIVFQRAAAISGVISSTGIANAKAVAASPLTFGQPWVSVNTISAAVSIGAIVAQAIRSLGETTKGFAMGGKVTANHGTPIQRSNGDNILATVKTGEVILNERQQAMLGGDATFRRMGVPGFASGGIVSASAQKSESISFQMQLYDAISRIQPVVTVEDINAGVRRVNVIESRAQVI